MKNGKRIIWAAAALGLAFWGGYGMGRSKDVGAGAARGQVEVEVEEKWEGSMVILGDGMVGFVKERSREAIDGAKTGVEGLKSILTPPGTEAKVIVDLETLLAFVDLFNQHLIAANETYRGRKNRGEVNISTSTPTYQDEGQMERSTVRQMGTEILMLELGILGVEKSEEFEELSAEEQKRVVEILGRMKNEVGMMRLVESYYGYVFGERHGVLKMGG